MGSRDRRPNGREKASRDVVEGALRERRKWFRPGRGPVARSLVGRAIHTSRDGSSGRREEGGDMDDGMGKVRERCGSYDRSAGLSLL